jgi:sulfur-oxidizing protein SoxZ
MADNIKMRAQLKDGVTELKVLMTHPMETGRRKNDLDEVVPAHFIQLVTVTLNGKVITEAQWGTGISKNPYLTLHLRGAKVGDTVGVVWHDNRGQSARHEIAVTAG